jgi:hypothetical protein
MYNITNKSSFDHLRAINLVTLAHQYTFLTLRGLIELVTFYVDLQQRVCTPQSIIPQASLEYFAPNMTIESTKNVPLVSSTVAVCGFIQVTRFKPQMTEWMGRPLYRFPALIMR